MSKVFDAYNKIDNTLFLNNYRGNLKFDIDESHKDCNGLKELVESLIIIRDCLLEERAFSKALAILGEKCVDVYFLKTSSSLEEYNKHIEFDQYHLLEKEYEFLIKVFKRVVNRGDEDCEKD